MSGVSIYTYDTLKQAIKDYTEVDDSVFTTTILDGFIMAAEYRINTELPMDADRFVQEGTLSTDNNTINCTFCTCIVRYVQIFVHCVQYTYNARTINCIGECYVQLVVSVSVPVQLNVSLLKYLYYCTIPEYTTSAQVPGKATTRT